MASLSAVVRLARRVSGHTCAPISIFFVPISPSRGVRISNVRTETCPSVAEGLSIASRQRMSPDATRSSSLEILLLSFRAFASLFCLLAKPSHLLHSLID